VTNSITKSFPITIPSKNWLVNHGFNTMDFIYVCFDENGFQMIPNEVSPQDVNNIRFNFTQPCRGRVVVSFAV
jgi:N-acetylglutamate synthase-like GNAT family acetyltransferase